MARSEATDIFVGLVVCLFARLLCLFLEIRAVGYSLGFGGVGCLSVLCFLLYGLLLCRESLQSHWAEQAEPMKQEAKHSVRGRGGTGD